MGVDDRRDPWPGEFVAGDLHRALVPDMDNDDVRIGAAHPDSLPHQGVRYGVTGMVVGDHRRVRRDLADLAETRGHGHGRYRVQAVAFDDLQHLGRDLQGGAVDPGIDLAHERLARGLQLGEGRVFRAEVAVFGDQVGFGDLHRVFYSALGGPVTRTAGCP